MLYQEITTLADSLRLAVVPESFPRCHHQTDCDRRVVEIVPFSHTDLYPLPGLLTWTVDDQRSATENNA